MNNLNTFTKQSDSPAFGIDLGTTNSCIAVVDNSGIAKTIKLSNGKMTMPSCVLWDSNKNEFIVGDEAYKERWRSNACYSVKRLMGSDSIVTFKHAGKKVTKTPVEVSSLILNGLVDLASESYKNIKDVVITVPAEFNTKQVEDTKKAADLAGLNVLSIMREPTAATLVYRLDQTPGNVLVYDLGGGTFDVSIVSIEKATPGDSALLGLLGIEDDDSSNKDSITVKATRGNTTLGGDDLDKEVYKIFEKRMKSHNVPVNLISSEDKEKLVLKIEGYKKIEGFSNVEIMLDLQLTNGQTYKGSEFLTEDDFIDGTRVVYLATKKYIDDVLTSSRSSVSKIVLVGGSTWNKHLREMISYDYPDTDVCCYLNPDESVADGAAINAKRIKFGSDDLEVFDVTSNSIGCLADGRVTSIIDKNQSIPCVQTKSLATSVDDQSQINVEIYEGSSIYPQEDLYLGNLVIKDIPKGKAGTVGVSVILSIDDSGLLTCEAQVGNKRKKVELMNILGRKVEKSDSDNKDSIIFDKWYSYANSLDSPSKEELTDLIDEARVEPNGKERVAKYISKLRKSEVNEKNR